MNFQEYIPYILFLVPILFAAISARRYNFIHGIVVFFTWAILLVGFNELMLNLIQEGKMFGNNQAIIDFTTKLTTEYLILVNICFVQPVRSFLTLLNLEKFATGGYFYGGIAVIWLVSQIFASILRSIRKSRYRGYRSKYRKY